MAPLSSFKQHRQRLAKAQRCMARKVKCSSRWKREKPGCKRFTDSASFESISAQLVVPRDLFRGQHIHHCQVIAKMCFAQLSLG